MVNPFGAACIGLIAGFVVVFGIEFIDKKLKIDDPVGAIGVHGLCGATGTLLTGLFAVDGGVFYGGGFSFLGVQALGVVSVIAWVTVMMVIIYTLIKKTIGLRVSPAEEIARPRRYRARPGQQLCRFYAHQRLCRPERIGRHRHTRRGSHRLRPRRSWA